VVDKIDEGCSYSTSPVKTKQVRGMRLEPHESVNWMGERIGVTYRTERRQGFRGIAHWREEL
jgi:hypothetical protein